MNTPLSLFEIECQGDTVIISPVIDLREFEYEQLVDEANEAFDYLEKTRNAKNLVVDFQKTDYFGSTALGFFLKLWKKVRDRKGQMAFCQLSDHEKEILTVTKLDSLWPICQSRDEALKLVAK